MLKGRGKREDGVLFLFRECWVVFFKIRLDIG